MATPSSPESIQRKPLPLATLSTLAEVQRMGESSESIGRKPFPTISVPSSGRLQEAPLSPVRVNIQQDNWAPRPSTGVIEGGDENVQDFSQGSADSDTARYQQGDIRVPTSQDLPYRPNYANQQPNQVMRPQSSRAISAESPDLKLRLNGAAADQLAGRPGNNMSETDVEEVQHPPVPQFQYHHQTRMSEGSNVRHPGPYSNDMVDIGQSIGRHLSPNSQTARHTPQLHRPRSAYSDLGGRGPSPARDAPNSPNWGGRAVSTYSGRSNDGRPLSYIDLANVSYPQAPPPPISMDNSQLRSAVGSNASLLSTQKTLDMYRQNIKKLNDPETQYAFAIFLIQAAQEAGLTLDGSEPSRKASPKPGGRDLESPYIEKPPTSPQELLNEAKHILQRLSDRSYPFAQYYLADGYASGLFNKGREDNGTAFPLFISASKHGHAESGYRAALCYEFGWGCRKDPAKAVQFYRQSASKNHPGAMTRLGRACLSGDLGMNKYREGLKWLKRATESADMQYNAAPYHLGLLYETGYGDDVFQDEGYAAELFTQAADLGHAEACYRMGDAYEHGKLSCPRDPALSVHFYTGAAQRGHPAAMMALCAWYMIGAEPVLEKDENEAYEWARQAAECGLTKAEYAVGYFTEMGIGTRRDPLEANVWYVKAADAGDERAKHRLAAIRAAAEGGTPMEVAPPRNGAKAKKAGSGSAKAGPNEKECIIM